MYVCVVCCRKCDTYVQDEGYGMIGLLFVVVAPDRAASLGRTCLVVTLLNPGVPGRGHLNVLFPLMVMCGKCPGMSVCVQGLIGSLAHSYLRT